MGTPENNKKKNPEVTLSLSIALKLQVLAFAREMSLKVDPQPEKLFKAIDEVKTILFPLVEWLDKPLGELWGVKDRSLKNKRGMAVFDQDSDKHLRNLPFWVALNREGDWYVRFLREDKRVVVEELSSEQLANLVFEQYLSILGCMGSLRMNELQVVGLLNQLPFLEEVAKYTAFCFFVSSLGKPAAKALEERELKIGLMKARLGLLSDFGHALDPLNNGVATHTLTFFSIFYDNERGTSRDSCDYLSATCFDQFWKDIKKENPDYASALHMAEHSLNLDSLGVLWSKLGYIWENICLFNQPSYRSQRGEGYRAFLSQSGRITFTKAEVKVLQDFASKL